MGLAQALKQTAWPLRTPPARTVSLLPPPTVTWNPVLRARKHALLAMISYNQAGVAAGNVGGCGTDGTSGTLASGGTQSVCTTDFCNDNTGTSPAFRAEFLSALVVAIFASLF